MQILKQITPYLEDLKVLQRTSQDLGYDFTLEQFCHVWKKYSDDWSAASWLLPPSSEEELTITVAKAILNYYK